MEFVNAISKPFTDWKKLIIGIALSIIPIVRWIARGYILESSDVAEKRARTRMPEWREWGSLLLKGFLVTVIGVVYMIPAIIIFVIGAGALILSLVSHYIKHVIPLGTLESVAAGTANERAITAVLEQNWAQAIPYLIGLAPIVLLALAVALLAAYVIPAAALSYQARADFGAAFKLGKVFRVAFTGEYFAAWLVAMVIGALIHAVLGWIPVVGFAAAFFIAGVFGFTLLGEAFRKAAPEKSARR